MSSFESLSLNQRWAVITKDSFLSIRKLVATIFAIPTSNASCERAFNLSKVQWSDPVSCMRMLTIDLNSVSCDPPTLGHMSRYNEAYIWENIFQLPSLTRLCLSEISSFGGFPSIPHLLSISEDRFKSFPEGVSDLSRMTSPVAQEWILWSFYTCLCMKHSSQRR